jgi:hypothetical protein
MTERGGLDEIPTNQAADGGCEAAAVTACARQPRPLNRATGWSLVVVGNDLTQSDKWIDAVRRASVTGL